MSSEPAHNPESPQSPSPSVHHERVILLLGAEHSDWTERLAEAAPARGIDCVRARDLGEAQRALAGRRPETILVSGPVEEADLSQHLAVLLSGQELALAQSEPRSSEEFLQQLDPLLIRAGARGQHQAVLTIQCLPENQRSTAKEHAELMRILRDRLRSSLREVDLFTVPGLDGAGTRFTGNGKDELIVSFTLDRPHDASTVGRRLMDLLARPCEIGDSVACPEFNGGISIYPEDGKDGPVLLEAARAAAREAARDGGGAMRYHAPGLNRAAFEILSMERSLRRALEEREFEVHYQPKVDIASERIVGFEALVRWKHPELGMISPDQFIPIAEQTGLILELGDYVLRQACEDAMAWSRKGLAPITMAVNLSSIQFRDPYLYERVMGLVNETGMDPRCLELELTESTLMDDAESAVNVLKRFKRHGIKISIDDFGTGYSSLAYLRRFPIDALKIDRSFITDINTNADDAAISTSIILMGRSLRLKVIAEGVENRSQLSFLRVMNCDEVQGYFFSPPVPAASALELLRKDQQPPSDVAA